MSHKRKPGNDSRLDGEPAIRAQPTTPHGPLGRRTYGLNFWLCYVANAALMIAVSILFRYADFVTFLGGGERQLGVIVGVGMIGALSMRLFLGVGIDRYGPRRIWLFSLMLFTGATWAHTMIATLHGPAVYIVRIIMMIGIAGSLGSALTYVSLRVPEPRIAEMVGTLGTSGFLGLAVGPTLGDWLFRSGVITRIQIDHMFGLAASLGILALIAAAVATGTEVRGGPRGKQPRLWELLRRYHPGPILLVAAAMGLGVGLPSVFLRTFTAERQVHGIKVFFLVYAAVAFSVRMSTRRLPERIGIRPVILMGLAAQALSMTLYLPVHRAWQLAIPASAAGIAHALLFPAIVAGGSISFPARYRGLATTLVLGMFDIGNLIGQPAIGNMLHYADQWGWPKYPTMFLSVAGVLVGIAVIYAAWTRAPSKAVGQQRGDLDQPAGRPRQLVAEPIATDQVPPPVLPGPPAAYSDR